MTLKSSKCSEETYRDSLYCWKKEFRSSVIKIVDSSLNSSPLSANSMCSVPASEDSFHFIKRRKMDEEYNCPLTHGNIRESTKGSFAATGGNSPPVHDTDGKSLTVSPSVETPAGSNMNNELPPSESSEPLYVSHRIKDALPNVKAAKSITELTSVKDLCISILKGDIFPTEESELRRTSTAIDPDDNETSPLFECMRCGSMEYPSKMLICDCCEGAFHLSCCNPRVKKIPEENWYCLVCKKKKPKRQLEKLRSPKGKLSKDIQRPRRGLGPIHDMLVGAEPYETSVRIGRMFQAEVPEWSGPISSNEDKFAEPSGLDPSEATMLSCSKQFKKTSVSNWIQCREVLDTGVICGKWRRAPLFVVQSSDWDCSCSVVWDPIHADCAVPQELETDEVLKQLKYINKLKNQLRDSNQKR